MGRLRWNEEGGEVAPDARKVGAQSGHVCHAAACVLWQRERLDTGESTLAFVFRALGERNVLEGHVAASSAARQCWVEADVPVLDDGARRLTRSGMNLRYP